MCISIDIDCISVLPVFVSLQEHCYNIGLSYFRYQDNFLLQTVFERWAEELQRNVDELVDLGGGLILIGDARYFSGKGVLAQM